MNKRFTQFDNTIRNTNIAKTYERKDYDQNALMQYARHIEHEDEEQVSDAISIKKQMFVEDQAAAIMTQQERKETLMLILQ